ncbi:hypothetical protein SS209_03291 [Salmonella enterica subsp. enterica serovar Senftenberg str. SS209]|nr:hypothetical protein SS209_03291 [Salmonella enterica subsp. enterica serovar Senftenberg str. SS209]
MTKGIYAAVSGLPAPAPVIK